MSAGGLAVAYSPPSIGTSAVPAPASGVYAGDGRVAKDAPWHVDALDFFFEGVPASNHVGVKPVTFHNRSDHEEHEIVFFKLADKSSTVEEAVAAADQFGEGGLVDAGFATAELGELKIGPDSTAEGSFDFAEPGAYVYYCFIETHGGHQHYGMVGKLLIAEPAAPPA
jgi:plastocyanin